MLVAVSGDVGVLAANARAVDMGFFLILTNDDYDYQAVSNYDRRTRLKGRRI